MRDLGPNTSLLENAFTYRSHESKPRTDIDNGGNDVKFPCLKEKKAMKNSVKEKPKKQTWGCGFTQGKLLVPVGVFCQQQAGTTPEDLQ